MIEDQEHFRDDKIVATRAHGRLPIREELVDHANKRLLTLVDGYDDRNAVGRRVCLGLSQCHVRRFYRLRPVLLAQQPCGADGSGHPLVQLEVARKWLR
jgi:hypothetical protein